MKTITIDRKQCIQHPRCTLCEQIIPGLLPHIGRMGSACIQDWALDQHQQRITNLASQCPAKAIEVQ